MAGTSHIRHHIGVVVQTRKITKAMHMISTSKAQKALRRFEDNARYFQQIRQTMKDLLYHNEGVSHPYLEKPQGERRVYIVIAADRGLAGGYNHEVLSLASRHMKGSGDYIFTVGQMARSFFKEEGRSIDVEFTNVMQHPTLDAARRIAETLLELYGEDMFDEAYLVYTHMVHSMEQHPKLLRILPLSAADFEDLQPSERRDYQIQYEPSPDAVLELLIPQYIIGLIYGALLLSFSSEHTARMHAMDAATRNADELLSRLSVELNQARQSAITREISEIMSGAEALEDANG